MSERNTEIGDIYQINCINRSTNIYNVILVHLICLVLSSAVLTVSIGRIMNDLSPLMSVFHIRYYTVSQKSSHF